MAKKYYSQRTKGYEKIKLGHGPTDLYHYGCYVVALTNLSPLGLTPPEVNTLLLKGGCFKDDLIINPERVAKLLNLEYNGVDYNVSKPPKYRTIAKVDMSPVVGVQSHFVVIKPDKSIVDSWTGDIRPKGTYPIVSYRMFKRIEDNTNSTITNPIELVTEDTPPMTPEVELKPVSEPVEPSGASYTAEPQIHFDKDKQVWLINKKNNMDLLKRLYDNKVLKMAGWNALGAFLSVLAIYLGDLSPQYSIILVPVILSITKYLNTKK